MRKGRVGLAEEAKNFSRWHGNLMVERHQFRWDGDGVECLACIGEEVIRGETGAGAVGLPLMTKQAWVGVDVAVPTWFSRARGVGAVLRVTTRVALGPETVEDEGEVLGAFGGVGVRVAKLR
jgi:hypothetical protein